MSLKTVLRQERALMLSVIGTLFFVSLIIPYIWKNPYIQNVPFAVLDEDNSALSRKITDYLKLSENLDVVYYPSSRDDLNEAILEGTVNAGIIIPENFSIDVINKKSPDCLIVADGSNILLSGNAVSGCAQVLGTVSAGSQMKILQGAGMNPDASQKTIGTLSYVERTVYEPTSGYTPRMMYALIPILVQQIFIVQFAVPLFTEKRIFFARNGKKRNIETIKEIALKMAVMLVWLTVISFLALLLVGGMRDLPLRGNIFVYIVLMVIFQLECLGVSLAISSITKQGTLLRWIWYMLSTTMMFFSGAVYPFYMMPKWLDRAAHCILPTGQMSMAFKNLNLKGVGFDVLMPDILGGITFSVCWILFGATVYIISIISVRKKLEKRMSERTGLKKFLETGSEI